MGGVGGGGFGPSRETLMWVSIPELAILPLYSVLLWLFRYHVMVVVFLYHTTDLGHGGASSRTLLCSVQASPLAAGQDSTEERSSRGCPKLGECTVDPYHLKAMFALMSSLPLACASGTRAIEFLPRSPPAHSSLPSSSSKSLRLR